MKEDEEEKIDRETGICTSRPLSLSLSSLLPMVVVAAADPLQALLLRL